MTVMNDLI